MRNKRTFFWTFFVITFITSCSETKSSNVGYVNSVKLFEEFEMKTEYDRLLERDLKVEAMLVDSIQTMMNHATDSMELYRLRKDYYVAEQLFNDKFEKLSRNYTTSVTERLDGYIEKYAKQKGYQLILTGNNGSVVYVEESTDVTADLIHFANSEFTKK